MNCGTGTCTSAPIGSRTKALSVQLNKALDELNVFIPPPIQAIIAKLALSQRGTY
jgi:hypothetical protein